MDSIYIPSEIETKLYKRWEENQFFSPQGQGQPYSIMIPPPNVTGSLHMGHAFQHTIQDTLIRLARMQGKQTLWQVGTDHAGIAVQMVVERNLAKANEPSRVELGRDKFTEKIWEWKKESGGTITRQMRRLGNSVDWDNERFTMDTGFSHAVQQVFIQLFDEGLIYRGKRLVNWDPKFHTAISDLEVENHEEKGHLWEFRYPLANGAKTEDGKDYLTIATTRPETMLGDTAVAVHPNDERYKHLVGKEVMLPLVNRLIPIIADHYVDPEFGTGCLKITPAHDFNDYQVGLRHQLPLFNIFDGSAAILAEADVYHVDGSVNKALDSYIPEAFHGIDRYDARQLVIDKLSDLGLFVRSKDHLLKVPRGDRSGLVIEPMLTDQWFVDAKTLAKPAIDAVKNGAIEFNPKPYENMFFSWMNDIQDWCISRQLWWGHRIPAWYDDEGKVYVGENEQQIRQKHQLGENISLTQDEDVLDTWFSSSLWTFATLGWPDNTERLQKFHPTDVLVTGFDIIFFWVARMMMMSMHFLKDENNQPQVPFKTVFITGLIRAENGQKMSKSKGNVIDPLDMIDGIDLDTLLDKRTRNLMQPKLAKQIDKQTRKEFPDGIAEHGTDALRFTLTSLASTGRSINWDMKRLEGYRNFCNKLWNASRYVLGHTENHPLEQVNTNNLSLTDRWIITKLQLCIHDVNEAFKRYRFDIVSQTLFEFIKNQYCDWYIELSKPVLFDKDSTEEQLAHTRHTLITVLESILRLAHPIMPFITEAIWQKVKIPAKIQGDSIMLAAYPAYNNTLIDHEAEAAIEWIKNIIMGIRNIRGELNISPSIELPVLFVNASEHDKSHLNNNIQFLKRLAKIKQVTVIEHGEETPLAATQLVGQLEVLVPLADFIDINKEKSRLQKEIDKTKKELQRLNAKLGNEKFIANAPQDVIDKEKDKYSKANNTLTTLEEQLIKLQAS